MILFLYLLKYNLNYNFPFKDSKSYNKMTNLKICNLEQKITTEPDYLGIAKHSETGQEFRVYGDLLKDTSENKVLLGFYKHKKGKFYEVIGVTNNPETKETLVVYKGMYEHEERGKEALWVRPIAMFFECDNNSIPRFKYIE